MSQIRNVAILIFDDVEVLDFCGPFEVFSVTGRAKKEQPFNVFTVAEKSDPILTRNHLSVNPRFTLAGSPAADILVVPGGLGTRREMNNPAVLDWVKEAASRAEVVLSVCTGALVLAKAGLLDGLTVTTHHVALELLKQTAPSCMVRADRRFVDNGKIITAAGISAGIDASLHVVGRLLGREVAQETARYMEYDWRPEAW